MPIPPLKRVLALLCVPPIALGISACASTSTSSGYKGEAHAVAQTISNLQSEAIAGEAQKICTDLLAGSVTARLNSAPGGCKQVLKNQISQVDTTELTIRSVKFQGPTGATAQVKSTYAGNSKVTTVTLVKENGAWKIAKLG